MKSTNQWLSYRLLTAMPAFTGCDGVKPKIEVNDAGTTPTPVKMGLTVDVPCKGEIQGWHSGDGLGYDVDVTLSADGKCRPYVSNAGSKSYDKDGKF